MGKLGNTREISFPARILMGETGSLRRKYGDARTAPRTDDRADT